MATIRKLDHLRHARVRQVVEVEFIRGEGVEDDPVRLVIQHYDFDGTLLAERDDCREWRDVPVVVEEEKNDAV